MLPRTGTIKESFKSLPFIHEPKHPLHVSSEKLYMEICKVGNNILAETLIVSGKIVKLPHGLGEVLVTKFKPTIKRAVDFKTTKEVFGEYNKEVDEFNSHIEEGQEKKKKKLILYNNMHTGGFAVRLRWEKKGQKARFHYKRIWGLSLTISHRRYNENSLVHYTQKHGVDHLIET